MALRPKIELVTMATVMAIFLKGFLIDAYKIPTGSMQPTLVGDEGSGISDRILVDRVSYAFREPRRFEIAVFRYPLDRSKTYVKRILGIGPEELRIQNGDLFHRANAEENWKALRRPEDVQEEAWLAVDSEEPKGPSWRVATMGRDWEVSGRTIVARGDGRAEFLHERGTIRDWYLDGYGEPLAGLITHRSQRSGRYAVGDLRLDTTVTALPGTRLITLELFEGGRRYAFRIPGPAAEDGAKPRIEVTGERSMETTAEAEEPWRLPANGAVDVRVQNLDDRLELRIEGRAPIPLDVAPLRDQTASVFVVSQGEGATFEDLMVYRDVYYTDDEAKQTEYVIPDGHYFMLGDNSQDSSDSRDWMLHRFQLSPEEGSRILRGEARRGENPRTVNSLYLDGPSTFFRDEWGESHWLDPEETVTIQPEHVPFVRRDQILGRAVAVFWPLDPRRDLYRLGFVR